MVGVKSSGVSGLFDRLEEKDWFEDKRSGLHCCFCHADYRNAINVTLYNHPIMKHIVCNSCLERLKELLNIQKSDAVV